MSFEDVYISEEGFNDITRLCKFLSKLIIKNNQEAKFYETKESKFEFQKYLDAYEDINGTVGYIYTRKDAISFGLSEEEIDHYSITSNRRTNRFRSFMKYMRNNIINNYVERNKYFRQFQGIPLENDQILYYKNYDSSNADDLIAVHLVTKDNYPFTYRELFVKNDIERVISLHPSFTYLYFIKDKLTPYRVSQLPNFSILYYDKNILNEDELKYFMNSYLKAKTLLNMSYKVPNEKFDYYSIVELSGFISNIVKFYMTSYIEKYSLRNYTRKQVNDIFISKGFKNLTNIEDDDLAYKICINLDRIIKDRASQSIIESIYKIIDDTTLTIFRFYLVKQYRINTRNQTDIDLTLPPEFSTNLQIEEVKIIGDGTGKFRDYNETTDSDPYWAGYGIDDPEDFRLKVINEYKRELLSTNFYRLQTKYILLSKVIEIIETFRTINDVFSIMMQYNQKILDQTGRYPFLDDTIMILDNMAISPFALFSAISYLNKLMEYPIEIADIIDNNKIIILNSVILRNYESLHDVLENVSEEYIDVASKLLSSKVVDYITVDEMLEYFPSWDDIDETTSLNDILINYADDLNGINQFEQIMYNKSNYDEYIAFKHVFKVNRLNINFSNLYLGFEKYSDFLNLHGNSLYKELEFEGMINNTGYVDQSKIKPLLSSLKVEFEKYLNTFLVDDLFIGDDYSNTVDDSYLNDLKIIFTEFFSIFTQLYDAEYELSLTDKPYNKIMIRYFNNDTTHIFNEYERLDIIYKDIFKQLDLKLETEKLTYNEYYNYVYNFFIEEADKFGIKKYTLLSYLVNLDFFDLNSLRYKDDFKLYKSVLDEFKYMYNISIKNVGFDISAEDEIKLNELSDNILSTLYITKINFENKIDNIDYSFNLDQINKINHRINFYKT